MSLPLFAAVIFFFAIGVLVSALYLYTQIAYFLTVRLLWIIRDYLKIPDRGQCVGYLTVNLKADTSQFMSDMEKAKKVAADLRGMLVSEPYVVAQDVVTAKATFPGVAKKASRRAKARN